MTSELFSNIAWQMGFGERAALDGLLCQLKPKLSIEIGTAEGGSLERIAVHSVAVHSFDLVEPTLAPTPHNVTLHTGDSHELLPLQLKRLSEVGENVDFVLVDGDHSSAGVRRDVEDLLNSEAIGETAIAIHDTANETVRAGLDGIHFGAWPKVNYVDLDFVAGRIFKEERLRHELWGGLGIVTVDSSRLAYTDPPTIEGRYYAAGHLLAEIRTRMVDQEELGELSADEHGDQGEDEEVRQTYGATADEKLVAHISELEAEILRLTSVSAHHEALWRGMMNSVSWKATTPLRALGALGRRQPRA